MGGVSVYYYCSWTSRPVLLCIILAALPCMLHCSESPAAAAAVGKIYPRGNHWAVGHLMGKKSIESLPGLQGSNHDSDYLTPSETAAGVTERLMEALMQQKNLKQTTPKSADRLLRLHSAWREEDRDKYLREMSDLFLLALRLRDNDST